jgi:hypothetical protein
MGAPSRLGTAWDRLYQRTVPIFWKPDARNPCLETARILQFRERSLLRPLGNWESLQMLDREADRAALRGEGYGAEGDGHPSRESAR